MMARWFRFYADAMRNPKVLKLSDKDFRLWIRLLSIASENEGRIPPDDELKLVLSARLDYVKGGLKRLLKAGLIDPLKSGYEPHNWQKFQYKSDTSTERVQKHRRFRNVSETPPDTETDTDNAKAPKTASIDGLCFGHGVAILTAAGKSETAARTLVGKWRKDYGAGEVIAALGQCQREGPVDPVAYIQKTLSTRRRKSGQDASVDYTTQAERDQWAAML
jgi:hypothetical protein